MGMQILTSVCSHDWKFIDVLSFVIQWSDDANISRSGPNLKFFELSKTFPNGVVDHGVYSTIRISSRNLKQTYFVSRLLTDSLSEKSETRSASAYLQVPKLYSNSKRTSDLEFAHKQNNVKGLFDFLAKRFAIYKTGNYYIRCYSLIFKGSRKTKLYGYR